MIYRRILVVAVTAAIATAVTGLAAAPASAAPNPISVSVTTSGELNVIDAVGSNGVKVHTTMGSGGVIVSSSARITHGANCRSFPAQRFQYGTFCTGVRTAAYLLDGGDDSLEISSFGGTVVADAGDGVDTILISGFVGSSVWLNGGNGVDTLTGGSGSDFLYGGDGNDTLKGMNGNDKIAGDSGTDVLRGNAGTDTLTARDGEYDVVDCGAHPSGKPDSASADISPQDKRIECELFI